MTDSFFEETLKEFFQLFPCQHRNPLVVDIGQICSKCDAIKSFLEDRHVAFVERVRERIEKMKVGHGNYHCGLDECCGKPTQKKKHSTEISDAECKGFNQALSKVLQLSDLLNIEELKRNL